jgi:tetratricopeptide (TPR) repeat protein
VAFRREAALLASVDHPLVPSMYEVGLTDGRPYVVMDLVSGRQLADLLAAEPLLPARAIRVLLDVLDPLVAVHRKGLVHRDIKPQNVLVQPDGSARLIDFGLATRDTTGAAKSPRVATVGTVAYAAPEQLGMFTRTVDARSDLYSLGVLLFECLTGRLPFVAEDIGELLHLHATAQPPDLRGLVADLPPMLAVVVETLLAKDPDDRYQSAANLAADLARIAAEPEAVFEPRSAARDLDPGDRLVGREVDLSRLFTRWTAARAGYGGVAVVRGPGGIGKSRLVAELVRRVRQADGFVLRAKSSVDDTVPMSALHDAVEGFLETLSRLPDGERDGMYAAVREAAGDAAPVIAPLSPRLEAVMGSPRLADADRQEQYPGAIARFLLRLARRCPGLVLFLDDLQWLDTGSRRVLAQVASQVTSVPLLVLTSCRNDEASGRAADELVRSLGPAVDLDLTVGPLDSSGLAALVGARLPGIDVGSRMVRLLAVRGDGNPFVTLEYLQAITDAGLLSPQWGGWHLDEGALAALQLPEDALGMVMARVAGLGAGVRRVLVTAAALGNVFHGGDVAAAVGGDRQEVMLALTDAASRRLIETRQAGSYAFVHDRIREALLEDLDQDSAAELHQHLATVLAAGEGDAPERLFAVADHVLRGHPAANPELSVPALRAAGRLALASQAREEAVRFLEPAAELLPGDPELLRELGTALLRAGEYTKAADRLPEALDAQRDPLGRAEVLLQSVRVHLAAWDAEPARAAALDGLRELGSPVPRNPIWLVLSTLGLFLAGLFVAFTRLGAGIADQHKRERYELVSELHTLAGYASTVNLRSDRLLMHNLRGLFPAFRLGWGSHHAKAVAGLGVAIAVSGLRRPSRWALRLARAEASRIGDPQLTALVDWYHGCAQFMGRLDDGQAWHECLEEHGRWLATELHHDAVACLVCEDVPRGRLEDAERCYELGLAQPRGSGRTEFTTLLPLGPVMHAMRGRAADRRRLRRIAPVVADGGDATGRHDHRGAAHAAGPAGAWRPLRPCGGVVPRPAPQPSVESATIPDRFSVHGPGAPGAVPRRPRRGTAAGAASCGPCRTGHPPCGCPHRLPQGLPPGVARRPGVPGTSAGQGAGPAGPGAPTPARRPGPGLRHGRHPRPCPGRSR